MKDVFLFIPNFGLAVSRRGLVCIPKSDKKVLDKLVGCGVDVRIVGHQFGGEAEFLDGEIENIDVAIIAASHDEAGFFGKSFNYLRSLAVLLRAILKMPAKGLVYIYFPGNNSVIAALLCILLGKTYALYVRGDWSHKKFYRYLAPLVFKCAKWLLVTGQGFCDGIRPFNANIETVSPMVSFGRERNLPSYSTGETVRLLFVGQLAESKGVFDIVKALKKVVDNENKVILHVVGSGLSKDIEKLKAAIALEGVESYVVIEGQISDKSRLIKLYTESDIFVYPSYYAEGFPRVIYEAMLCGKPICCTILDGMKGFMINEKNCIEVCPKNSEDIAEKLLLLVSDKSIRKSLGQQAYKDVVSYLSKFEGIDHADQILSRLAA